MASFSPGLILARRLLISFPVWLLAPPLLAPRPSRDSAVCAGQRTPAAVHCGAGDAVDELARQRIGAGPPYRFYKSAGRRDEAISSGQGRAAGSDKKRPPPGRIPPASVF